MSAADSVSAQVGREVLAGEGGAVADEVGDRSTLTGEHLAAYLGT